MKMTFQQLDLLLKKRNVGSFLKLFYSTPLFEPNIRDFFSWYRKNEPKQGQDRPFTAQEYLDLIKIILRCDLKKPEFSLFDSILKELGINPEQPIWRNLTLPLVTKMCLADQLAPICGILSQSNIEVNENHPIFAKYSIGTRSLNALQTILTQLSQLKKLNNDTLALVLSLGNYPQIASLFYSEYLIGVNKRWDEIMSHPQPALVMRGLSKLISLGYLQVMDKDVLYNKFVTADNLEATVHALETLSKIEGAHFNDALLELAIERPDARLDRDYEATIGVRRQDVAPKPKFRDKLDVVIVESNTAANNLGPDMELIEPVEPPIRRAFQ